MLPTRSLEEIRKKQGRSGRNVIVAICIDRCYDVLVERTPEDKEVIAKLPERAAFFIPRDSRFFVVLL